jgi:hypothetical protein
VRLKTTKDEVEASCGTLAIFLTNLLAAHPKPDLVVIELYMSPAGSKSAAATITALLLRGAAEGVFRKAGIEPKDVAPSTVRAHFIGRANCGDRITTNNEIVRRAWLLGLMPKDDNSQDRANAIAVWDHACHTHGRAVPRALALFGEKP